MALAPENLVAFDAHRRRFGVESADGEHPNRISCLADVANGDIVMATVPISSDPTSRNGGLAILYGPPAAVAERPITDFGQSLGRGQPDRGQRFRSSHHFSHHPGVTGWTSRLRLSLYFRPVSTARYGLLPHFAPFTRWKPKVRSVVPQLTGRAARHVHQGDN
jgi:hypothetical protein